MGGELAVHAYAARSCAVVRHGLRPAARSDRTVTAACELLPRLIIQLVGMYIHVQ
jgi:hypothetical protein